ncbi:hypothetical protein FPRO04_12243 [Fusarium proliferatum]|nr:hypothetical protein FPRO04_12243 [Fusarium proliferatum]
MDASPIRNAAPVPTSATAQIHPPRPTLESAQKSTTSPQAIQYTHDVYSSPRNPEWDVSRIVQALKNFRPDIKNVHARMVSYLIEITKPMERRVLTGEDLFASLSSKPVLADGVDTMRIKFKEHSTPDSKKRDDRYKVRPIETDKEHVPRYRSHHVEIKKNILTPNTMLMFIPYLKDLESSEETKYRLWLQEVEDVDRKSGFNPMSREEKRRVTVRSEVASTVSLYLENWLVRLKLPGCDKSTLIRYMANRKLDDTIPPQQKSDTLNAHRPAESITPPEADWAVEIFMEAFDRVFYQNESSMKQIMLRDVLLPDESIDNIMAAKPAVKDSSPCLDGDEFEAAETNLETYCILGCLLCFSHSCEHGEYDASNIKHCLSMLPRLSDTLRRRRNIPSDKTNVAKSHPHNTCKRNCHQISVTSLVQSAQRPWTSEERSLMRSMVVAAKHSRVQTDPFCIVALLINRDCRDVFLEYQCLGVSLPPYEPGKTCLSKQRDSPCVCVQLHRECDPDLCDTCGVLERADPESAKDERLHATGCQNCALQRSPTKTLVLGQSQLEGVGYGLFTAEFIAQGDFIIEYVGELITHDEGVRREARRGGVFDERSDISYLFTLLETEGIWLDAAVYGNLSRYINHASEKSGVDKCGCNITPQVLYVNGEYRIKFTAIRDIQAGEELFFNYGKNFPNLTKKLLDHKTEKILDGAKKGKRLPKHKRQYEMGKTVQCQEDLERPRKRR